MATADRIHRLARWMLSREDVDDVVQDIYLRAWERLPELRDPAAFTGWLRRLAINVILRHRERAALIDLGTPLDVVEVAVSAAPPGLRLDLERAVARLPEGARTVFVLFDVEGYRHHEIAQLLGISDHTSRSQLHRARSLLRDLLSDTEEL